MSTVYKLCAIIAWKPRCCAVCGVRCAVCGVRHGNIHIVRSVKVDTDTRIRKTCCDQHQNKLCGSKYRGYMLFFL